MVRPANAGRALTHGPELTRSDSQAIRDSEGGNSAGSRRGVRGLIESHPDLHLNIHIAPARRRASIAISRERKMPCEACRRLACEMLSWRFRANIVDAHRGDRQFFPLISMIILAHPKGFEPLASAFGGKNRALR